LELGWHPRGTAAGELPPFCLWAPTGERFGSRRQRPSQKLLGRRDFALQPLPSPRTFLPDRGGSCREAEASGVALQGNSPMPPVATCLRSVAFPAARTGAGSLSPLPAAALDSEPACSQRAPSPALPNGPSESRWVSGRGKQCDCGGREAPCCQMVPISSPAKCVFTAGIAVPLREALPKAKGGVGDPGPFLLHAGRMWSFPGSAARHGQGLNTSGRLASLSPGKPWGKPIAVGTDVPEIVCRISAAHTHGTDADPPAPWPAQPGVSLSRARGEEVKRSWKSLSPEPGHQLTALLAPVPASLGLRGQSIP